MLTSKASARLWKPCGKVLTRLQRRNTSEIRSIPFRWGGGGAHFIELCGMWMPSHPEKLDDLWLPQSTCIMAFQNGSLSTPIYYLVSTGSHGTTKIFTLNLKAQMEQKRKHCSPVIAGKWMKQIKRGISGRRRPMRESLVMCCQWQR